MAEAAKFEALPILKHGHEPQEGEPFFKVALVDPR
jgi:hypothetical protein